jgi:hypothetical protein
VLKAGRRGPECPFPASIGPQLSIRDPDVFPGNLADFKSVGVPLLISSSCYPSGGVLITSKEEHILLTIRDTSESWKGRP